MPRKCKPSLTIHPRRRRLRSNRPQSLLLRQAVRQDRQSLLLLQQALVNLLMNALQASPSGGEVVVTSGGESRGVRITIQDQGPGIPDADLEQIFKPFFTTRHSGTGLGLPISRGIIEQHGGRLTVESGPGGGARFTVTLPLQDPPVPEETT